MTHPTKPLAAILYFGELGEKLNAQRKKNFGASKLGQKTTFKRYPFLKLRRLFHPNGGVQNLFGRSDYWGHICALEAELYLPLKVNDICDF